MSKLWRCGPLWNWDDLFAGDILGQILERKLLKHETVDRDPERPHINRLGQVGCSRLETLRRAKRFRARLIVYLKIGSLAMDHSCEVSDLWPIRQVNVGAAVLCSEENIVWLDVPICELHRLVQKEHSLGYSFENKLYDFLSTVCF